MSQDLSLVKDWGKKCGLPQTHYYKFGYVSADDFSKCSLLSKKAHKQVDYVAKFIS